MKRYIEVGGGQGRTGPTAEGSLRASQNIVRSLRGCWPLGVLWAAWWITEFLAAVWR